ncbi:MAG: hypothetical protein JNK85_06945 [Verrucomicrobiales bacterium]|nr:hypothetical protein [Verrucomicrobiales bacterium]
MNTGKLDQRSRSVRASKVALAAMLVTAASGYFMGLRQTTGNTPRAVQAADLHPQTAPFPKDGVPKIVEYRRMGEARLGPNAGWTNHLSKLQTQAPKSLSPGIPADELDRLRAVQWRASRRAFDGAPPVIPHPVEQQTVDSCLVCHQEGRAIRDRVAPRLSHPVYGNCTQCHVPDRNSSIAGMEGPALAPTFGDNLFVGLSSSGRGGRAWPGAPPVIPHSTMMRSECLSCHGPLGLNGLRTPHPERSQCQQCHVPQNGMDDTPLATAGFTQLSLP